MSMVTKIDEYYSRDEGNQVYYEGRLLFNVDGESFISVGNRFGKDTQSVYFQGELLPHADVSSFYVDDKGMGWDETGYCISDDFAMDSTPVYTIIPGKGIQNRMGKKLCFGMTQEEVIKVIGHPWQSGDNFFSPPFFSKISSSSKIRPFWAWDYKHLGLILEFDEVGDLCHFVFKPDYEDLMGCKVNFKRKELFDMRITSLRQLTRMGFEFTDHTSLLSLYHVNSGIVISIHTGEEMNLPSGEEIYPPKEYFIVSMSMATSSYRSVLQEDPHSFNMPQWLIA